MNTNGHMDESIIQSHIAPMTAAEGAVNTCRGLCRFLDFLPKFLYELCKFGYEHTVFQRVVKENFKGK